MSRQTWKAGNMLYPLPAVLVSVADRAGRSNVFTGMDGDDLFRSAHGVHIRQTGTLFLPYDRGDGRICDQSDDRITRLCNGLLRC